MMEITLVVEEAGGSLVARLEEKVVGHLDFVLVEQGLIDLSHTEVAPEFGGRGFGGELVRAAVAYAETNQLKLRASCPFARRILERNPDDLKLLG